MYHASPRSNSLWTFAQQRDSGQSGVVQSTPNQTLSSHVGLSTMTISISMPASARFCWITSAIFWVTGMFSG